MEGFWKPGERREISELSGISLQHLSEILHRKRSVGKHRARMLEDITTIVLGKPIPLEDWIFNSSTTHPAFFNSPER